MWKSALLIGLVAFVVVLGFYTVISPACTPCAAIILGLLAGYLACLFNKPATAEQRLKQGALAGAIAGVGAVIGSTLGGLINGLIMTSEVGQMYYVQYCSGYGITMDPTTIWTGQAVWMCILIPVNIILMAVLGLAGAAIWHKTNPVRPPAPAASAAPTQG